MLKKKQLYDNSNRPFISLSDHTKKTTIVTEKKFP